MTNDEETREEGWTRWAESQADQVYASPDVHHQCDNISWSRTLQTLAVNRDGGGLLDLVDISNLTDDQLHALADLDGEHTMHALADHTYWSRP